MIVKAVSLWQPWASLVALGEKKVETRSWRCPLPPGTVLAIHAAKKWNQDLAALCLTEPFRAAMADAGVPASPCSWTTEMVAARRVGWGLPFGAVVCLARLAECLPTKEALARPGLVSTREMRFGDYSPGRWCWVFDRVYRLDPPAPARGMQAVWDWDAPEALAGAVRALGEGGSK